MNTAKMTDDLIKRGVTQVEIASFCGVHQSTVSRWRKGTDPEGPSRDKLFQLYEATFGPGALQIEGIEDDEAMRATLFEMFDRIKDRNLRLVAIRQIAALADQAAASPQPAPSDPDAKPQQ